MCRLHQNTFKTLDLWIAFIDPLFQITTHFLQYDTHLLTPSLAISSSAPAYGLGRHFQLIQH